MPPRKKKRAASSAAKTRAKHKRQAARATDTRALRSRYGIGLEDFYAMVSAAKGRCEICGRTVGRRLAQVDHDHRTGRPRGILHRDCNLGLGLFRDSPARLRRAAAYLERHARKRKKPKRKAWHKLARQR